MKNILKLILMVMLLTNLSCRKTVLNLPFKEGRYKGTFIRKENLRRTGSVTEILFIKGKYEVTKDRTQQNSKFGAGDYELPDGSIQFNDENIFLTYNWRLLSGTYKYSFDGFNLKLWRSEYGISEEFSLVREQ